MRSFLPLCLRFYLVSWRSAILPALWLGATHLCGAYSVLTHEQVVELLWKDSIQPLLLARFPNATPDDLLKAHAYAYGGSVVQGIGYYSFGTKIFRQPTH